MNFAAAVVIDGCAIPAAAATSATHAPLRLRLAVYVRLSWLPASLSICLSVSLCTGRHPTESPPPSLFMRHQRRRRPVGACASLQVCLLLSAPPKRSATAHRHSATHSPSTSRSLPAAAAEPPPPRNRRRRRRRRHCPRRRRASSGPIIPCAAARVQLQPVPLGRHRPMGRCPVSQGRFVQSGGRPLGERRRRRVRAERRAAGGRAKQSNILGAARPPRAPAPGTEIRGAGRRCGWQTARCEHRARGRVVRSAAAAVVVVTIA